MNKFALAITFAALTLTQAGAQDAPLAKVDVKPLKVSEVETPQFQAGNVGEKRWRPKKWLEADMEFDIKLPPAAGGRNGSLESMQVNFYVAMNAQTKDRKYIVLKGSFNFVDIPAAETCHALVYVSPATLRRVLQKDNFTAASDIKAWGFEVLVGGKLVAGDTSTPGKWWESTESFSIEDNVMLAKNETPFAILWGDYDVSAKKP